MGLFGAEVAVFVDATGQQVLHQAGLDALLLADERLGLLDGSINRRKDLGDLGLLGVPSSGYSNRIFLSFCFNSESRALDCLIHVEP